MGKAIFIYSPEVHQYRRGGKHPATPNRLKRLYELLTAYGALDAARVEVVAPRLASEDELATFHSREYIRAVRAMSEAAYESRIPDGLVPQQFGYATGGNPIFPGMFNAGAVRAGGGLQAVELLLSGYADRVFHPAGGGHHGQPTRTSGFCVFNDVVIAIKKLVAQNLRVAYVDVDAHHGDGVQEAFYDDPRVLTISLHESGDSLFPGTGDVDEVGIGAGRGYALNLPFLRETDDEIYLRAFCEIVPRTLAAFAPDVLVTEIGADAHSLDPLAHLKLTTRAFEEMTRTFRDSGIKRWLCVGGGGYRESVVPRVWALVWAEMTGLSLADELPASYRAEYSEDLFLRDRGTVELDAERHELARGHAAACVEFLQNEIALPSR